ncbi:MAG: 4-alpha-glucanotransferase [Chthoniobacter sp.]|jgi:4-alpha-glucanotransferase|nr:4-alpha-glucanotransferase [Chthoniobacter sp.]
MTLSPDKPIAGILAPLFAVRSESDLGVGDVDCLRQLIDWAADSGFHVVQLLPINETGADNSPYMAVSSVALEPSTIFISPESIPDLTQEVFEKTLSSLDLGKLRAGPVLYAIVKGLKLRLLERAFDNFLTTESKRNSPRARSFRQWAEEQSCWLDSYACFRVLMEQNEVNERWDLWPAEQQNYAAAKSWLAAQSANRRKEFERRTRFYKYVQWIAFAQWREVQRHADARDVALVGDVPFGISYYSADVFAQPELFDLKWSGGAPPEPYFKDDIFTQKWGQNWGMPLYRWDAMRAENFAWWRQRVRIVREIFQLFRIDHVLGFYRIYAFPWRPQENAEYVALTPQEASAKTGGELPRFIGRNDENKTNCDQNCAQGEEFLKVLLEETGAHRLLGEDLGTVPEYVRPNLTALGIAGFKIPMWETKPDGWLIDGADYQRLSIVTYATHDHEPLKARWERLLQTVQAGKGESAGAWDEMKKFAAFAKIALREPQPWSDELHEKMLRALFHCNSWIAVCMLTDLFGTEERFNVPGAVTESNWSTRLPQTVKQWRGDPALTKKMARVSEFLRETKRV